MGSICAHRHSGFIGAFEDSDGRLVWLGSQSDRQQNLDVGHGVRMFNKGLGMNE